MSNRNERRRNGSSTKKEPIINIKASDITKIKNEAYEEATKVAFLLMLGIPALALRDEGYGKIRLERFLDHTLEIYKAFSTGVITLEDIKNTLLEEAGFEVEQ